MLHRVERSLWIATGLLGCAACQYAHDREFPDIVQVPISAKAAAFATPVASPPVVASTAAVSPALESRRAKPPSLHVKRWVIATGVREREPVIVDAPLRANGTPIYAFAELSNPDGASENVRVTFERRGGKERVGDVKLPVPGNAPRHRTWAFTRNIVAAGTWEAVLWSESGAELGRTSFDVS